MLIVSSVLYELSHQNEILDDVVSSVWVPLGSSLGLVVPSLVLT